MVRAAVFLGLLAWATTVSAAEDTDCELGEWYAVEECQGLTLTQRFTRDVKVQPSGRGAACGPTHETRRCQPVHCQMGDWTPWSDCDADGYKTRTREKAQDPKYGGRACPHWIDRVKCRSEDCLVSCWSEWQCDPESGKKTRSRHVVRPVRLTGAKCPHLIEQEDCDPVKEGEKQDAKQEEDKEKEEEENKDDKEEVKKEEKQQAEKDEEEVDEKQNEKPDEKEDEKKDQKQDEKVDTNQDEKKDDEKQDEKKSEKVDGQEGEKKNDTEEEKRDENVNDNDEEKQEDKVDDNEEEKKNDEKDEEEEDAKKNEQQGPSESTPVRKPQDCVLQDAKDVAFGACVENRSKGCWSKSKVLGILRDPEPGGVACPDLATRTIVEVCPPVPCVTEWVFVDDQCDRFGMRKAQLVVREQGKYGAPQCKERVGLARDETKCPPVDCEEYAAHEVQFGNCTKTKESTKVWRKQKVLSIKTQPRYGGRACRPLSERMVEQLCEELEVKAYANAYGQPDSK